MFRRIAPALALCLTPLLSSMASAAIIFEPVQSQYGSNPGYHYGGSSPRVFAMAERMQAFQDKGSLIGNYLTQESSGYGQIHPGLIGQAPLIFSDRRPYVNVSVYNFNEMDARNEAYMNVPRYFRMADVVGVRTDGHLVVPAQGVPADSTVGSIEVKPFHGGAATQPATQASAKRVFIFPKRLLDKPLKPAHKSVADAR